MEFKGVMGGFYRISEWIMRFAAINVLWLVCSLPVVLLFMSAMFTISSVNELYSSLVLLAIVVPFTLFPATSAMFAVARKWVMGDEDVPLFRTFFRSYKDNYKQSMLGGLLYTLIFVVVFVNFKFYIGQTGNLHVISILFIALSIVLFASLFHFFSILAHFHMKLVHIIKNAILITIGNPFSAVALLLTNGAILYISFAKFTFLIPFFMGSLMAYISFWYFNRLFVKVQSKQEKLQQAEAEKASNDKTNT